jgi:hypothetical protein
MRASGCRATGDDEEAAVWDAKAVKWHERADAIAAELGEDWYMRKHEDP